MNSHYDRKTFLQNSAFVVGTLLLGNSSCANAGVSMKRDLRFLTLDSVLQEIEILEKAKAVQLNGEWDLSQVCIHCAQSIEYSMTGYPENKPYLIQVTIGKIVSSRFLKQGYMSHNLNDPVPGAPSLDKSSDYKPTLQRLKTAIHSFQGFREPLQPHFVYGDASKENYEKFHAMHIANHFSAVEILT